MKKTWICTIFFVFISGFLFPQSVAITSPDGGERWKISKHKDITWHASDGLGDLRITLWKNGLMIGTIANYLDAASGKYDWQVGKYSGGIAGPGKGYKVKIKEIGKPVSDISEDSFEILPGFQDKKMENPSQPKVSGPRFPDFAVRNVRHVSSSNMGRVEFDIANLGRAFTGDLDVTVTCPLLPAADKRYTLTFSSSHPLPASGSDPRGYSEYFEWPRASCFLAWVIVLDPDHKIRELNQPNVWEGEVYQSGITDPGFEYVRFWPKEMLRFKSGGTWHRQSDRLTYYINSPEDVIYTKNLTILLDVAFTIKCCNTRGVTVKPKMEYYGNGNKYHEDKLGDIRVGPGKEKEIQRRIQLRVREENFIIVSFFRGSKHVACVVNFKFGKKFFENYLDD